MRLFQAGYQVPDGFVLTSTFFEPWFMRLQASSVWSEFLAADRSKLARVCPRLQELIEGSELSIQQQKILADELGDRQKGFLFAVRSSSPEEDLERASFAGAYRTVLGVDATHVPAILPAIVASSLDHRIVLYKLNRAIAPTRPRIAVIIQEQVSSEVSGIAFSCNPVTGDTTQVVIESNWGLGTAIVEGRVSPDYFLVDKLTRQILDSRSLSTGLPAEQLQTLVTLLLDVERLYQRPIDVEWTMQGGTIFLLQARPVTAYLRKVTNPTKA